MDQESDSQPDPQRNETAELTLTQGDLNLTLHGRYDNGAAIVPLDFPLWGKWQLGAKGATSPKPAEATPSVEFDKPTLVEASLDDFGIARFFREIALRDSSFAAGLLPTLPNARGRLDALIERGTIVVLRKRGERVLDAATTALREERTIARAFKRLQSDKKLHLPGRRLLLVASADYRSVPRRDSYQVVPNREAAALLSTAAGTPGLEGRARDTLQKAVAQLAPDWRAPQTLEGLVLLRELPPVAAVAREEAPLTPSQIRALKEAEKKINLEVVVLGPDSELLKVIDFAIEAPDGDGHEGDLGPSGRTTIASAKQGPAKVALVWSAQPPGG